MLAQVAVPHEPGFHPGHSMLGGAVEVRNGVFDDVGTGDEDEDDHVAIVLDAGRLCWAVGRAGDDAPLFATEQLTPHIIAPVVAAHRASGDAAAWGRSLSVWADAVQASDAELWPTRSSSSTPSSAAASAASSPATPQRWQVPADIGDATEQRLCLSELRARHPRGSGCRAFGAELVDLGLQDRDGVSAASGGALPLLWAVNCALLSCFLRQRWGGLSMRRAAIGLLCTVPALQDISGGSKTLAEIERIAFDATGPLAQAGYQCARLVVQPQELMGIYASGRVTGLAVNYGLELSTYAIYEGYVLPACARRRQPQPGLTAAADVAQLALEAAMSAPIDVRRELLGCVVLLGRGVLDHGAVDGSCHFRQLVEREFAALVGVCESRPASAARAFGVGSGCGCRVIAPPERAWSAWIGASIVMSIDRGSRVPALRPGVRGAHYDDVLLQATLLPPCRHAQIVAAHRRLAWAGALLPSRLAEPTSTGTGKNLAPALVQLPEGQPPPRPERRPELADALPPDVLRRVGEALASLDRRLCAARGWRPLREQDDAEAVDNARAEQAALAQGPRRCGGSAGAQVGGLLRTPTDPPDSVVGAGGHERIGVGLTLGPQRGGLGRPLIGMAFDEAEEDAIAAASWAEVWSALAKADSQDGTGGAMLLPEGLRHPSRGDQPRPADGGAIALRCPVWLWNNGQRWV
eukprot:COSAG01_NODE_7210_length_3304_cov_2.853354_3_plen_693_part_00